MENYIITRERFGQYSMEFIIAVTHALRILEISKEIEKNGTSTKLSVDIKKIRKVFDLEKISKSFIILSKPMQEIFKNALHQCST